MALSVNLVQCFKILTSATRRVLVQRFNFQNILSLQSPSSSIFSVQLIEFKCICSPNLSFLQVFSLLNKIGNFPIFIYQGNLNLTRWQLQFKTIKVLYPAYLI